MNERRKFTYEEEEVIVIFAIQCGNNNRVIDWIIHEEGNFRFLLICFSISLFIQLVNQGNAIFM